MGSMEESAEPPRKPRGKPPRQTGAEKMARQQQEFEDRGAPSKDEVKKAAAHNETQPKLKRELAKRRSTASEFLDRPVKRMRLSEPATRSPQPRRRTRRQRRTRRPRGFTRVSKRRDRQLCTCSRCLKKPVCRKNMTNFCVYVVNKRIGTDTCPEEEVEPKIVMPVQGPSLSKAALGASVSRTSIGRSLSSYNSYYSYDHEPMV